MKLVGLAFCFGFLTSGSPSQFLLTSGVLGKIKGSLYQPILFLENLVSLIFLFFFKNFEKFKASLSPCMQGQFGGARSCKCFQISLFMASSAWALNFSAEIDLTGSKLKPLQKFKVLNRKTSKKPTLK